MPTANDVLEFFRRHDGLAENPAGSNRTWIGEWYGWNGQPWCNMAVSRAFAEAGFGTPDHVQVPGMTNTTRKGWAYCKYCMDAFKAAGLWIADKNAGQPGDAVFFGWDPDSHPDHIGIVESRLSDGTYLCREGNTSNNLLQQRRRSQKVILGFGRPPYDGLGGPPADKLAGGTRVFPGRLLRYPPMTIGEDVKVWQTRMVERGWKSMVADGAYGPASREICRKFQTEKGLKADGIVGQQTWDRAWGPA